MYIDKKTSGSWFFVWFLKSEDYIKCEASVFINFPYPIQLLHKIYYIIKKTRDLKVTEWQIKRLYFFQYNFFTTYNSSLY